MKTTYFLYFVAVALLCSLTACDTEKVTTSVVKPNTQNTNRTPRKAPTVSQNNDTNDDAIKKGVLVRFTQSVQIEEALRVAKQQNKPVFVDCFTDWCAPCKLMDEYVFSDPTFANYLNTNFIPYKFDGANFDADTYVKRYQIKGYPTIMFIAPSGKVISSHFGGLSFSQMQRMAQEALAKHKSGS